MVRGIDERIYHPEELDRLEGHANYEKVLETLQGFKHSPLPTFHTP
jgi:hypothetical protein